MAMRRGEGGAGGAGAKAIVREAIVRSLRFGIGDDMMTSICHV
jgi:hypothetical protein